MMKKEMSVLAKDVFALTVAFFTGVMFTIVLFAQQYVRI
jgi:hypothetical protein